MQFLIDKGFDENIVFKIIDKYDNSILELIRLNKDNVELIIDYFNSVKIQNIDYLMLYRIELFMMEFSYLKEVFTKFGILRIIKLLSEDISNIDYVL